MTFRSVRRALSLLAALFLSRAAFAGQMVKISVTQDGVYRVSDRELAAAGAAFSPEEIPRLRLTVRGEEVPVLLEKLPAGSPEGRFAVEFIGLFPRGTATWENPYTRVNLYVLDVAPPGVRPVRIAGQPAPRLPKGIAPRASSPERLHFEMNRLLVRFTGGTLAEETWFWDEVKGTDPQARTYPIDVAAVEPGSKARLRVRFMGHSSLPQNPDHTVQVALNGSALGDAVWDGESPHLFESELPAGLLKDGRNVLSLRAPGEKTSGIDLVLLDWVELSCTVQTRVGASGQTTFWADARHPVELLDAPGGAIRIFDSSSPRVFTIAEDEDPPVFDPTTVTEMEPDGSGAIRGRARGLFYAVGSGRTLKVSGIEVSHPAQLDTPGSGADFVIVAHRKFLGAAERLAAYRRGQGLTTRVVDVADLYDRFNHGFLSPDAVRDFVRTARRSWRPAPRYLLLIGDASWDYKNDFVSDENYADWNYQGGAGIGKNGSTPYRAPSDVNARQFVPTFQYQTPWGHAASDNAFASFESPDGVPELAVGRFPVATPEEADAVVDKIIAYEKLPPGSLNGALFVTNGEEGFVQQAETVATEGKNGGLAIDRVYPKQVGKARFASTEALREGFDRGPGYVLFIGHGGRYVWHIGHENDGKPYDLFGINHVDELHETARLPLVVSLTCYSAPFDHPLADSIGEKLLRTPHKGAIAVVAASWRNAPPIQLGRQLFELLTRPGEQRIGDAFVEAKRTLAADRLTLGIYNLLGDPATIYRGAPFSPPPPPRSASRETAGPATP